MQNQNQNTKPIDSSTALPPVQMGGVGAAGAGVPVQGGAGTANATGGVSAAGGTSAAGVLTPAGRLANAQAQKKGETPTINKSQEVFLRKIVDKVKSSENILVALSRDPSVDELAAAIGLTMFLDGIQKHATAIYSGQTPDVLQFLQPESTFESSTEGLRDFIIALNRDKADSLRYKLEGEFVRVYITPYKEQITENDLEFSYGDYNVNLVLAIGVPSAGDLDAALSEHGRIMHDATTVDITVDVPGKFAEIEWSNPEASSVSEMVTKLIFAIQGSEANMDKDVATALLTGIVAATGRFSNDKTNSETMQLASKLMAMGADQQLISMHLTDESGYGQGGYGYSQMSNGYGQGMAYGAPVMQETYVETVTPEQATEVSMEFTNQVEDIAKDRVEDPMAVVVQPDVVAEVASTEAVPDALKQRDASEIAAAAKAAVNEAMAAATANIAASGANGVGFGDMAGTQAVSPEDKLKQEVQTVSGVTNEMNPSSTMVGEAPVLSTGKTDYAEMMAQALAEGNGVASAPGVGTQVAQSPVAETPSSPAAAAGDQVQTTGSVANSAPVASPVPVAEPVADSVSAAEPAMNSGVVLPPPPEPNPVLNGDMMPPVLPQVQAPAPGEFRIPGM